MRPIVVHVIRRLGSDQSDRVLRRLISHDDLADGRVRHVILSLAVQGARRFSSKHPQAEVRYLNLTKAVSYLVVVVRLAAILRRIRPTVIMTWDHKASLVATIAAKIGGTGSGRLVWNLSSANQNLSNLTVRNYVLLRALAWLSGSIFAIASTSGSVRRVHEALGFKPRRWVYIPNSTRRSRLRGTLHAYHQLWRFAIQDPVLTRDRFQKLFGWLGEWKIARLRRLRLAQTTFIAVTGSCGKTVATRLTGAILAVDGPCYMRGGLGNVLRSSINTVLTVPTSSKYCVQEVSGYPPGDIPQHIRVLRPQIAIVTTIGSDHYKSYRSLEAVAKAKGQLVEQLPPHGTAILNADDPHVRAMAVRTNARVITFGRSPDAEIRATEVCSAWPNRLTLRVTYAQEKQLVRTRLVGEHWVTSVLAAIACGVVCGIKLKSCAEILDRFSPVFGRYSVHTGPEGEVYALDTRKAPYWTVAAGLAFVKSARAPRKTIIVGTMSDYPGSSSPKYRQVAREALDIADRVIFVGPNSGHVSKLRKEQFVERLFVFQSTYQASLFLAKNVIPKELIYIKASISDHLERIMLSRNDQVVCWRERCKIKEVQCSRCRNYFKAHAAPLGLLSTHG